MLNRSVVIVRVKEPFLQWVKSLPDSADVSKNIINHDNTAYLLPDLDYGFEEEELVEQFYDLIFEDQLHGWWKERNDWPAKRDLEMFKKWYEIEFHYVVLDLVDAPLQDDE
jgi:hypothetical protein